MFYCIKCKKALEAQDAYDYESKIYCFDCAPENFGNSIKSKFEAGTVDWSTLIKALGKGLTAVAVFSIIVSWSYHSEELGLIPILFALGIGILMPVILISNSDSGALWNTVYVIDYLLLAPIASVITLFLTSILTAMVYNIIH